MIYTRIYFVIYSCNIWFALGYILWYILATYDFKLHSALHPIAGEIKRCTCHSQLFSWQDLSTTEVSRLCCESWSQSDQLYHHINCIQLPRYRTVHCSQLADYCGHWKKRAISSNEERDAELADVTAKFCTVVTFNERHCRITIIITIITTNTNGGDLISN